MELRGPGSNARRSLEPGPLTLEFETVSGDYTESQFGSYIFTVGHYGGNLDRDGVPTTAFEPSLFVWATIPAG